MPRDDAHDAALDPRTMTPVWYARETRLAHMLPYVSLVDDETVRMRRFCPIDFAVAARRFTGPTARGELVGESRTRSF
jgi:hypothetical protein